ncbi:MAG: serine/threonine protein phosphatase [Synechococcaceae cyanobacterium RL_1_2]|nr:serine/threonine protein phosphatase [Synechococcaceae cyanobacterium RL_1_2]
MTKRQIVIGDIHGHFHALRALLNFMEPTQDDQIYFLGDLIDRGPHSNKVVELVMEHNYACLRGNHEEMLLDTIASHDWNSEIAQAWLKSGGNQTITSYRGEIPAHHLEWIAQLPHYIDLGDYWLVHAGVDPEKPLTEQDSEQFCWVRNIFHYHPEAYFPNKTIITGHTLTFNFPKAKPGQIVGGPGWLCIETGVYHRYSGWLTALDLNSQEVYQFCVQTRKKRKLPLEEILVTLSPK